MYYDYFGLKQPPFKITPDTSLFFPGGDRGAILDALIYAIVSGEGIVKLVGEVGSGKTTLCRMLEKELPQNVEIVYLANPSLSPDNILHAIAFELHLKVRPDDSRLKVMNSLQNYLLEKHAENKQVVVFVEEAQSMPIATLEEIRLLSNLETAQNKLLQIAIFGQPELDVMISKPEIRQLKERITYSFYLNPFKPDEVKDYINSRLRACGYRSVELFSEGAIKTISKFSNGLLRRINILSDKALLAAYADNSSVVTVKHVKIAAKETEFVMTSHSPLLKWAVPVLSAMLVIVLAFSFVTIKSQYNNIASEDKGQSALVDLAEESVSVTTPASSLMLVKDVRGKENNDLVVSETKVKSPEETSKQSLKENTIVDEIVVSDVGEQETKQINKPSFEDLAEAQWQKIDNNVVYYPERNMEKTLVSQEQQNGLSKSELLEIEDLIKALKEKGEDDMALLNQLAILPSETVINRKFTGTELTCELCSTIIYRPLKKDKNL